MSSMKEFLPILSITGSDSAGGAGIQADIKTISSLGGHAMTAITSVTMQNLHGIQSVHNMPADVVAGQLRSVLGDMTPRAVKVGMVGTVETLSVITQELKHVGHIVADPGVETSRGERLMNREMISEICHRLFPISEVVVLRQHEAELVLRRDIVSNDEMIEAAQTLLCYGMQAVAIYGGHCNPGLLATVLVRKGKEPRFYTLPESGIWKIHGLGGILSSAIATHLGQSGDVEQAVSKAHEYVQSLVLYSVELHGGERTELWDNKGSNKYATDRQAELYHKFMQLVASHCRVQHDVAFYARQLCVSSRYLAQVVGHVTGKTPKQLIVGYIIRETEQQIRCTQKPLQEICFDFGFSSQSQFSKFFKQHTGLSPSQIR